MPKGKKYGGRDFQPGNTASVGHGRPKKTEELREIEKAVGDKLADIARLLTIDAKEASDILTNPKSSLLENFIAGALQKRDAGTIFAILDRVLGKPKQRTEVITDRAPIRLSYENPRKETELDVKKEEKPKPKRKKKSTKRGKL